MDDINESNIYSNITNAVKDHLQSKNRGTKINVLSIETGSGEELASSATSTLTTCKVIVQVNNNSETHRVFCKNVYDGDRQFVTRSKMYEKEIGMYKQLVPFINKFQESRNVTPLPLAVPIFYGSSSSLLYLLLNDIRADGFHTSGRNYFDKDEVDISVREMAKMHAIGHAITSVYKDRIVEMFPFLQETIFRKEMFNALYHRWTRIYDGAIHLVSCIDPHIGKRMTKYQNKVFDTLLEQVNRCDETFRTICHGDLWFSNIMFLYDKLGVPIGVKFVDFQNVKVGSLALDLTFFLYTSTTSEFRKENYSNVLQTYFNQFQSTLIHLGMDDMTPKLTLDGLKQEMMESLPFAVTFMSFAMPMQLNGDPKTFQANDLKTCQENQYSYEVPDQWKEADRTVGDLEKYAQIVMARRVSKNMHHPSVKYRMFEFYREMAEQGVI